jgi:ATP-dependent DNA helicase RecG
VTASRAALPRRAAPAPSTDPLQRRLAGVSGKLAGKLRDLLGLETVEDLLRYYPRSHIAAEPTPIKGLDVGQVVTFVGEITEARHERNKTRPGSRTVATVVDPTGRLTLTWFSAKDWSRQVRAGRYLIFGRVTRFGSRLEMTSPQIELLKAGDDPAAAVRRLIPVYRTKEKLPSWEIKRAVELVVDDAEKLPELLPAGVRAEHGLLPIGAAVRGYHLPRDWAERDAARRRLAFDEALLLQVELARRRRSAAAQPAQPRPRRPDGLLAAFDAQLPFPLTAGQLAVGEELFAELARDRPMHRLLQGEVGSGKTVVALRAMLAAVDAGGQAALLAPTDVLAHQHSRTIAALLGPLGRAGQLDAADQATAVALLTGSLGAAARRSALQAALDGTAGIVIGTHALLEEGVRFADLGLVVVDEQHRFGVEQRDALRSKGDRPPHLLVMTATPIPRTVAMTVFGDLETTTLTEIPGGRAPVTTSVVPRRDKPHWLDRAWQRVREEVAAGHQVFVVCPRIGGGDGAEDPADAPPDDPDLEPDDQLPGSTGAGVLETLPLLRDGPLTGLRLAALHGRLPAETKDDVMTGFAAGRIDVLVATTVVEVGVDVPRATCMIILDADRFGVSQLHQLRGRVGRGGDPALCLLVTDAPADSPARARLDAVAGTTDGFELARLDLEQRREGDVLGTRQSGPQGRLQLLELLRDEQLILAARRVAGRLVADDPELTRHPELAAALAEALAERDAEFLEKA